MTINTRKRLEADLDELKRMIFMMGRMSGSAVESAVSALKSRDAGAAQKVVESDDMIDELEERIDNGCMEFAARYQPLGEDLRAVTSLMHIAVDLERIGDYGGNIAKAVIDTAHREPMKPLIDIPKMANQVAKMLQTSLTAMDTRSAELALTVFHMDDVVDDLEKKIVRDLFDILLESLEKIEQAFQLMNVSRTLERAGDHVTNVAERVAYMYTGRPTRASSYRRKRDE